VPTSTANDTVSLTQGPNLKVNSDSPTKWNNQLIDGLAGFDTIVVNENSTKTSYFSFSMSHDAIVTFTSASGGNSKTVTFTNFEKIQFWDVNMYLGTAGNDALTGTAFAENIYGFDGDDSIDGGAGNDKMFGGAGNDTYTLSAAGDIVSEKAGEGIDTILAGFTYSLVDTDGAGADGGNVENLTLTGTGNFDATGNDLANLLTGNSGINTLTGGAGNDTLDGGGNADVMVGGLGNDTYIVDNAGDTVTENAGEGTQDTVKSSVSYTLGANVENLTLTGTDAINGTGNTSGNKITGNSGNNVLTGGLGKDKLAGKLGADTFDYNATKESAVGTKHDIIQDFKHGTDKIDLSTIDADTTTGGNGAFTLLTTLDAAFTGHAGELHFTSILNASNVRTGTMVEGDVNGDGVADFQIELSGIVNLTAIDFIL
jgi:Ca2+-binding RTX toxin-like protein